MPQVPQDPGPVPAQFGYTFEWMGVFPYLSGPLTGIIQGPNTTTPVGQLNLAREGIGSS